MTETCGSCQTHKIGPDFQVSPSIWKCSCCGSIGPWGRTWSWYGKRECRKCGQEVIDYVACTDACRQALSATFRLT